MRFGVVVVLLLWCYFCFLRKAKVGRLFQMESERQGGRKHRELRYSYAS